MGSSIACKRGSTRAAAAWVLDARRAQQHRSTLLHRALTHHPPAPSRRYPGRNELTGGFAGGELGLQAFKEKGDVPIAPNGQGTRQSSPLITAFVLGLAATGGGLLLSTVEEAGLSAVSTVEGAGGGAGPRGGAGCSPRWRGGPGAGCPRGGGGGGGRVCLAAEQPAHGSASMAPCCTCTRAACA